MTDGKRYQPTVSAIPTRRHSVQISSEQSLNARQWERREKSWKALGKNKNNRFAKASILKSALRNYGTEKAEAGGSGEGKCTGREDEYIHI